MKHLVFVAALVMGAGLKVWAGELDNESSVTNQSMNGTIVVRIDTRTEEKTVLTSEQIMTSDAQAENLAKAGVFQKISDQNLRHELDQDAGASSWYFCYNCNNYNSYSYSYMYWYGTWYTPCYSYSYGFYQYYYYSYYRW